MAMFGHTQTGDRSSLENFVYTQIEKLRTDSIVEIWRKYQFIYKKMCVHKKNVRLEKGLNICEVELALESRKYFNEVFLLLMMKIVCLTVKMVIVNGIVSWRRVNCLTQRRVNCLTYKNICWIIYIY